MILEAKSVHTYAEYAMIRGGIECAAVAWWLLEPPSQRERVSRSLRVFWADTKDMGLVYQDASSWRRTKRQRLEWRNAVALANGIDSGTLDGGYNMTSVLTTMSTKMGSGVLTAWRVASGMTHGRSWAMLAMSAQEFGVAGDDNTIPVRISADLDSLGMIFHNAAVAMQDAYSMFHRRRAPTQRTALGLPLQ
ncbi:hypothetical protein FBY41_2984 [Humibacillus xanthopallidus]|uniref:Uncharacterized protein n=2 Tax=Humibacillus xanthopallidus TaxID=412689 RepID=A0A543HXB9_9MICO|nr:hypothetical protein FBY41_2984 [Humibacillus xanthopallidus]